MTWKGSSDSSDSTFSMRISKSFTSSKTYCSYIFIWTYFSPGMILTLPVLCFYTSCKLTDSESRDKISLFSIFNCYYDIAFVCILFILSKINLYLAIILPVLEFFFSWNRSKFLSVFLTNSELASFIWYKFSDFANVVNP